MSKHHKKKGRGSSRGKKGQLWMLLFNKEKYGKCWVCGKPLLFDDATIEHIIPLGEKGSDTIESGNLTVSCLKCNNDRARKAQVLKRADKMAKRIYDMCNGIKEITPRMEDIVNSLVTLDNITIEICKKAYLNKKGYNEKV